MKEAVLLALLLTGCAPVEGPSEPAQEHAQEGLALDEAELAAAGITFVQAEPAEWSAELSVFGAVVHDPLAQARVVAPHAGRLVAPDPAPALALGREFAAGQVLFLLAPRWSPAEELDRAARRASATSERVALEASLPALVQAAERARTLNAEDKSVSDRELEEANARLAVAESQLAGARALEQALERGAELLPLALARAGTLVALAAQAGEEVEAGLELARVEDLTSLLVRLDLSARHASLPAGEARIELPSGASVTATFVALAPEGDAAPVVARLYRVNDERARRELRPGALVQAWLPASDAPRSGVTVPDAALVRLAAATFVYVRQADGSLARVPVELGRRGPQGWYVTGVEPGSELVGTGAESVLTLELLGRQGEDEE